MSDVDEIKFLKAEIDMINEKLDNVIEEHAATRDALMEENQLREKNEKNLIKMNLLIFDF